MLLDPYMERASILPLWSASKAYHLFGSDHAWNEMLGVLTLTHVTTLASISQFHKLMIAITMVLLT
jgi:hypothetical protein